MDGNLGRTIQQNRNANLITDEENSCKNIEKLGSNGVTEIIILHSVQLV